jgi:hypothetical protein
MQQPTADYSMSNVSESQLASTVMMIRPAGFEGNPLTAESNTFMVETSKPPAEQQTDALREFEGLVEVLRNAGINVVVIDDTRDPHTPDAILYPMEAENRRTERRYDIVEYLVASCGRLVTEVIDLSGHERAGHFLEGTGSMVLDRVNRIAYACVSSRTHLDPLGDFAQRMDYDVVVFDAVDDDGLPIYHTNVLMNVGERVAVICDAAIPRAEQREAVLARLHETGHEIIHLSYAQLHAFAGNMLELRNRDGDRVVAMSEQAWNSLDDRQRELLVENGRIVYAPIKTIETSAGGSVRCMLAEIHLPPEGESQE